MLFMFGISIHLYNLAGKEKKIKERRKEEKKLLRETIGSCKDCKSTFRHLVIYVMWTLKSLKELKLNKKKKKGIWNRQVFLLFEVQQS